MENFYFLFQSKDKVLIQKMQNFLA